MTGNAPKARMFILSVQIYILFLDSLTYERLSFFSGSKTDSRKSGYIRTIEHLR